MPAWIRTRGASCKYALWKAGSAEEDESDPQKTARWAMTRQRARNWRKSTAKGVRHQPLVRRLRRERIVHELAEWKSSASAAVTTCG